MFQPLTAIALPPRLKRTVPAKQQTPNDHWEVYPESKVRTAAEVNRTVRIPFAAPSAEFDTAAANRARMMTTTITHAPSGDRPSLREETHDGSWIVTEVAADIRPSFVKELNCRYGLASFGTIPSDENPGDRAGITILIEDKCAIQVKKPPPWQRCSYRLHRSHHRTCL